MLTRSGVATCVGRKAIKSRVTRPAMKGEQRRPRAGSEPAICHQIEGSFTVFTETLNALAWIVVAIVGVVVTLFAIEEQEPAWSFVGVAMLLLVMLRLCTIFGLWLPEQEINRRVEERLKQAPIVQVPEN